MHPIEKKLVEAFLRTRSETAFNSLYYHMGGYLHRMAKQLSAGNEADTDDLLQETWVIGIRKLEGFEWRSSLKTWMVSILMNVAKRRWQLDKRTYEQGVVETETHPSSLPIDLESAFAALPVGCRQVAILHDMEGYTHEEIASLLGISEGTSKSQLFHARKKLRSFLK